MVFSSHVFLFYFLPLVVLGYYLIPKIGRHLFLTVVSYVFYGWWNPWFTLLMLASTAVDYWCGKVIASGEAVGDRGRMRLGMLISVTSNLGVLAFFKYTAFLMESAQGMASWMEWGVLPVPEFFRNIVLPVGISFYVFQSMSYCIDLYRGHAKPADSFVDFACYVALFPQLVAGPIVRYGSVAEQLRSRVHTVENFSLGVTRFCLGFAKKIMLADPMGAIADGAFGAGTGSLTTAMAWVGIGAYALQIYFDFSAYSDMAIGLGRMFGFHFIENFASPYKSVSITDFWRRWHISLSTFLRDYLYIPLGGNRKGPARTYINLMATMLLGGLWHGASWNFVAWGAIHGGVLALERWFGKHASLARLPRVIKMAYTLVIVLVGWVFFRAENFEVAVGYLKVMFVGAEVRPTALMLQAELLSGANLVTMAVGLFAVWLMPNTQTILRRFVLWKAVLGLVLFVVAVAMMFTSGFSPFLYFQF
ncbi:MBOAT family protein [Phragmitibacter flavus]|uniref:MBOAT family protein n=1 Tax=Phragmitibacter flavus TaxID=2576071 RepID=A0A5R8KF44_9BACT|nr:MBOAT family protein [Phragmitibacter flavus]